MVSPVLIGVPRFELGTSPTRTERATRLRHTPSGVQSSNGFGTEPSRFDRYVVEEDNEGGNVNVVSLIGNLCTDVELKHLNGDKKVATFLLAVDRPGEGADFVGIATWDRQAEVCAEHLSKGAQVGVDGRLRSRSWQDADGNRRSAIEVVANRVQFLGRRGTEDSPFEAAA
jgi:single-strand DNA-binding protein